jgi:hypothetical protein
MKEDVLKNKMRVDGQLPKIRKILKNIFPFLPCQPAYCRNEG